MQGQGKRVAGGLAGRLDRLSTEHAEARVRALAYLAGAPLAALAGVVRLVGAPAAALTAACALVAAWWWARAARRARHDYEWAVDDLLLYGWENAAPGIVGARRDELLSPRHRRRLARLLLTGMYAAPACPPGAGPSQLLAELRRQRECVDRVVAVLQDVTHPLDVRGIILVHRLLSDAEESPLHAGPPEALRTELQRIDRLII